MGKSTKTVMGSTHEHARGVKWPDLNDNLLPILPVLIPFC